MDRNPPRPRESKLDGIYEAGTEAREIQIPKMEDDIFRLSERELQAIKKMSARTEAAQNIQDTKPKSPADKARIQRTVELLNQDMADARRDWAKKRMSRRYLGKSLPEWWPPKEAKASFAIKLQTFRALYRIHKTNMAGGAKVERNLIEIGDFIELCERRFPNKKEIQAIMDALI